MANNNITLFEFNSDAGIKTDWKKESIINQDRFIEILSKIEESDENNLKFQEIIY